MASFSPLPSTSEGTAKRYARHDDDAIWLDVPTGREIYDCDEDCMVAEYDYVLAGSRPLDYFDAMLFASEGIDGIFNPMALEI